MLVEVYGYIENILDNERYTFYEKDLRLRYENRIQHFFFDVTIKKAKFRHKIMNYLDFLRIQHINDRYWNAFTFPDGIKKNDAIIARKKSKNSKNESNKIFSKETTSSGSLIEYENINISLTSKSNVNDFIWYKINSDIVQTTSWNKRWSTNMTDQILPFVHPEFSVITETADHFFCWTTGKEFVRDNLKVLV